MNKFKIGEKVNYRQRNGYLESGVVVKINGSLIHVQGEDGGKPWVVHENNIPNVSWDWIEKI